MLQVALVFDFGFQVPDFFFREFDPWVLQLEDMRVGVVGLFEECFEDNGFFSLGLDPGFF